MSSKLSVLISGASIAGPALAYWLIRAGCRVTVVERAPTLRSAGQGVDIRDSAREVVKQMGIFDTIRNKSSHEEGLRLVDGDNRMLASFGVDLESGNGDSPTSDVEILRGELAGILFDETKEDVSYIFGDMIQSLEETEGSTRVTFANGTPTTAYDLVVAADGMGSKTRELVFGKGSAQIKSLNSYVSYFSVPIGSTDSMWARVHWIPGGRNISVRPDNVGRTRAFMTVTAYDGADPRLVRFAKAAKEGISAQKALVQEMFQDGDWEVPRLLEGMHVSTDFYMQHVAQVRLERWSSGRVTVVGDAGYAPSPFTGMGTSLAFIGAYVLAGEISRQPHDVRAALESYERVLRPYVESVQKLPPGIPWLVNPQSKIGVRVLETFGWICGKVAGTWISAFFTKLGDFVPAGNLPFTLPEYEAFKNR